MLAEEALSEGLIEKKHRDYLDSVAFFQTDNGAEDLKNLLSVLRENKDSIPGPLLDQAIRSPNYDTSLSILESMLSTEISADNASELFSQARHYFPSNIRDKLATNDRVLKKRYGFLTTQLLPKVITKMLAAQTLDSKQSRILMEKLHGHEDNRYDAAYASFRVHNTLRNIAGLDIDESLLKSVARDISLYVNVNSDVYNDRLSDILPPRTSNHEEALRAIRFKI